MGRRRFWASTIRPVKLFDVYYVGLTNLNHGAPRCMGKATDGGVAAWLEKCGARGRDRTADTAIFNRMLYQLSYPGLPGAAWRAPERAGLLIGVVGAVQPAR